MNRRIGVWATLAVVAAWSGEAAAQPAEDAPKLASIQRRGQAPSLAPPLRGVEIGVLTGPAFDDQLVAAMATNIMLRYFASDAWAIGIEGTIVQAIDPASELERWQTDRLGTAAQVSWVAHHDRLGDGSHPAVDLYVLGAIGVMSTKPVPLSQEQGIRVAVAAQAGVGLGARLTLTSWLTTALELRNDSYLGAESRNVTSARLGLAFLFATGQSSHVAVASDAFGPPGL